MKDTKSNYKEMFNKLSETPKRNVNDKVMIVDGLNLFIRCFGAVPTLNDDGEHVGGVTGCLLSLGALIRKNKPTRVLVVFDGKGGSTQRKKKFSGYKAQRDSNKLRVNRAYKGMMNDEDERESMKRQFVWLNEMLDGLPLTTMIYDGVEADDIMAYISTKLLK